MSLTISLKDVIQHIKLSCQIPKVLEDVAQAKIIANEASKIGIKISDEELQEEGDKFRFEQKLVKAKDTWDWLKKHRLSLDEFEDVIYTKVVSRKLAKHLFSNKVESFFYQNQAHYLAAVTYEVILESMDLALELFYSLQEGEITFPDIARQYITDPELRRAGGYMGARSRNEFRTEIVSSVFAASPPQILKPINTGKGVYLIWVEEIIEPILDDELRERIISDCFLTWLKEEVEQKEIFIHINPDTYSQPEELLKQGAKAY
jgi:parvulin-like peptidyl-prolyl isomerase